MKKERPKSKGWFAAYCEERKRLEKAYREADRALTKFYRYTPHEWAIKEYESSQENKRENLCSKLPQEK